MMLQYQRQKSPSMYQLIHSMLADYYQTRCQRLSPSNEEWTNEQWRKCRLAYAYHFLVANSGQHWSEVMSLFVIAIRKRCSFAIEMIEMLSLNDVQDELSDEQKNTVQLFRQQLQAVNNGNFDDGFEMFDKLCD